MLRKVLAIDDSALILQMYKLFFRKVGGPFRTQAQVVDVVIGEDGVSRLNLRFLEDRPSRAAGSRSDGGRIHAAGQVTVQSGIPPQTPHREAIEEAIWEALRSAPGSWAIEIVPLVARHHRELFWMSSRPADQNRQLVRDRVREVVRRSDSVDWRGPR